MENQQQKWVTLSFIAFAALVSFVLFSLGVKLSAAWDLEARIHNIDMVLRIGSLVIGVALLVGLYWNERSRTFMEEVVSELTRVTWPTYKETVTGTIVTLVMVLISGLILWLLDSLWVYMLHLVL